VLDKENIVKLTFREHYLVHLCLYKMIKSPKLKAKMLYAITAMCVGRIRNSLLPSNLYASRKFEMKMKDWLQSRGAFQLTMDTIWINNGIKSKRIAVDDTTQYISNGWAQGRLTFSRTSQIYVTKDGIRKRIYPEFTQQYLSDGWLPGLPKTAKICVTNGSHNIYVLPDMIPMGYVPGSYQKTCAGRVWVNNGVSDLYLKQGEVVPTGWMIGRLNYNKHMPTNTGKIKITNGVIGKWIPITQAIPTGWDKGSPPNRKKGWKRKKSSITQAPSTHDALIPDGQALV
jgi:hypothetical protein